MGEEDGDAWRALALPLVQFVARPGIIDLGWGHPDPGLLPVDALKAAATRVFDRYGVDALNYGSPAGPGPLIGWLSKWIGEIDGRRASPDEISISAGTSQAIDHLVTLLTRPGDIVLCETPTYHLALRILQEHPVELVPVPVDEEGISVDGLPETIRSLSAAGRNVRLLYTVPTFANPTGISLNLERRHKLVELASDHGFVIIEDDAYRELSYEGPPPPSLWSMAPPGTVVRLGSFAKSLAPGLRCGYITANATTISRIRDSGVLDSGGGISHFAALVIAEFASSAGYAGNVQNLRSNYRKRRDALLEGLTEYAAAKASWTRPEGGYFAWLTLADATGGALVSRAEANGTSFLPGDVFSLMPSAASHNIRLSFSRYSPEELREAARRLGHALRS